MKLTIALVAVCIVGVINPAQSEALRCDIATKKWCVATSCNEGDGGGEYVIVNPDNGTYSLCVVGKADCEILQIRDASFHGAFYTVKFGGNSFIKIATQSIDLVGLQKDKFIEVRDNMLGVMSSFGKCNSLQ